MTSWSKPISDCSALDKAIATGRERVEALQTTVHLKRRTKLVVTGETLMFTRVATQTAAGAGTGVITEPWRWTRKKDCDVPFSLTLSRKLMSSENR